MKKHILTLILLLLILTSVSYSQTLIQSNWFGGTQLIDSNQTKTFTVSNYYGRWYQGTLMAVSDTLEASYESTFALPILVLPGETLIIYPTMINVISTSTIVYVRLKDSLGTDTFRYTFGGY
jgi:hypothetical protein